MRRYFEEEMRYLHEAGKAFAEAHPEQARFLNVDSVTDRDPYVERLFEGFAFLAGRIHERLDDDLPEYTESLLALLYPHLLRPIPALAISEFKPKSGQVNEATVLDKGTEVRTGPTGEERAVCRFVTTEAVVLRPLSLDHVELAWPGDGT
ncbi:MAG: type VI secretion system baseplate subunit TssF, partial [Rhodothermia bacterium]|nr:type VI secretion system baseplate subunit TssF [Rhodothermia bacterium]